MEIEICEFAKIFFSGLIVCAGSLFASLESVKTDQFSFNPYLCLPFPAMFKNSLEAAGVICLFATVAPILHIRACPKVTRQVVERVAIFVIRFHSIRSIRNNSVHINSFSLSNQLGSRSHGIIRFCMWVIVCLPLVLIEFLVPLIGYLRDLASCKLNQFHFNLQKEAARSGWVSIQNRRDFKMLGWLLPADIMDYTMNGAS